MNGAYGVGPLAFERVGEAMIHGFWIVAGFVVAITVVRMVINWRRS